MTVSRIFKSANGHGTRARTAASPEPQKTAASARRERLDSEAEVAAYIAQLSAELSTMAQAAHFDLVAYFLSLARLEAEMIARRPQLEDLRA